MMMTKTRLFNLKIGKTIINLKDYYVIMNFIVSRIQLGLPFHQFVLPVSLGANDEARITLTYEQMLSKKEENYNYVVSLSPGERVDDFQVRLSIVDERNLGHVKITAPVIGTIADQEVVAVKEYQHRFNMTLVDQALNFGRHGFTGDLVMQFSLEEDLNEVVFND